MCKILAFDERLLFSLYCGNLCLGMVLHIVVSEYFRLKGRLAMHYLRCKLPNKSSLYKNKVHFVRLNYVNVSGFN